MKPVSAKPLEKVVADRLIQLGQQDQTVAKLVQEAMEDTSELLGNLGQRQANLATRRQRVQSQIDALVEGLSQRIMPIKSGGVFKIVELEEQKEQLDNAALDVGLEIDATKAKVVSAQSSTKSLTTFEDFYPAALPEERRELIRLRVNQLIWTPEEIRLALLDGEEAAVTAVQREATVGSPDVGFN